MRWPGLGPRRRGQEGITGLETAIILIAFVVVASIFAYSVVSAGIFSTEKSKQAISEGLEAARSSMELVGGVVARDVDSNGNIDEIIFTLANALQGEAINLQVTTDTDADGTLSDEGNKQHTTVITYIDAFQRISDIAWTKAGVGRNDGDDLLEPGEKFEIAVNLAGVSSAYPVDAHHTFTIEVKPDAGAGITFDRTIPAKVDNFMDLR